MKKTTDKKYMKPTLVVYGDFNKITKMTGSGAYTDAAFPAFTPGAQITFTS